VKSVVLFVAIKIGKILGVFSTKNDGSCAQKSQFLKIFLFLSIQTFTPIPLPKKSPIFDKFAQIEPIVKGPIWPEDR